VVSKYVEAHYQLGDALLLKEDFAGAIAQYEKVLAAPITPDTWMAYDGLGVALYSTGEAVEARDALESSLRLNKFNAMGLLRLGDARSMLADTTGAIAAYEQALSLAPWDLDNANNLAWLYAVKGERLDRALELATLTTRDTKEANYFDTLCWVYFKMGDLAAAAEAAERALELEPKRAESMWHLALVRQAQGRTDDMSSLLRRVIELDAGGDFARKAAGLLGQ
jgi:tetratricopeptide (TPR) repeat protein